MKAAFRQFFITPAPALEHDLILRYGPFLGHALHILGEIGHVAAFLTLGILVGQNRGTVRQDGGFAFSFALVVGMFVPQAWTAWSAFTAIEKLASAGGIATTGLLILLARPLTSGQLAVLAAFTGAIHGIAGGLMVSSKAPWLVSTMGTLVASLSIAMAGLIIGAKLSTQTQRVGIRIIGSGTLLLGLVLLAGCTRLAGSV